MPVRLLMLSIAAMVTVGIGGTVAGSETQQSIDLVLVDVPDREDAHAGTDPTIMRSRPVLLDPQQIIDARPAPGTAIRLILFDDASVVLVVDRAEPRPGNRRLLSGHVTGRSKGNFTMVLSRRVVIGNIRIPGRSTHYQIRYLGEAVHVVREIDETKFPPCETTGDDEMRMPAPTTPNRGTVGGCDDDGSVIDVLVAYTPAARDGEGGTAGIEALIILVEAETNQAYVNSRIRTTVRVIMMHEVDYVQLSARRDLTRIKRPNDGYMDEVPCLRNLVRADVVSLFIYHPACGGLAYMSIKPGNVPSPELAYNLVATSCATGNYIFAHELGHNQGCLHDRTTDPSDYGAYLYSHGYQDPAGAFRTIMAYVDGCAGPCPRIQHFSNPGIRVWNDNFPLCAHDTDWAPIRTCGSTGVAEGHVCVPSNCPQNDCDPSTCPWEYSADNAKSINNTAYNVANFRPPQDCNENKICDNCDLDCGSPGGGCDVVGCGASHDCNDNGLPDECDIAWGLSEDCNGNGIPDECDIEPGGPSEDCNDNGIPDDCEQGP